MLNDDSYAECFRDLPPGWEHDKALSREAWMRVRRKAEAEQYAPVIEVSDAILALMAADEAAATIPKRYRRSVNAAVAVRERANNSRPEARRAFLDSPISSMWKPAVPRRYHGIVTSYMEALDRLHAAQAAIDADKAALSEREERVRMLLH